MFRTDFLSIIRSLNTVLTATVICHTSYVVCLLADSQHNFFFLWLCDPTQVVASSFLRFLDHTQRRTTVGRTPLDEWSGRRRDLYLTTHNTHNRQTSITPVGFESTISAGERPQTYALDRAATGTGTVNTTSMKNTNCCEYSVETSDDGQ